MKIIIINFILFIPFLFSQEIFTDYLIEESDTIDVFSYQIPDSYNENNLHPLLVAFHQWGGNENSNYSTQFDEEANSKNWIMLSPFGGSSNNYNHQVMQQMVENEILWMMNNYKIDHNKIYMVGGSMGGASGAIYANNHLDPTKPMVAATASASGILDCERRAIEMDGNNSMIEWFGGEWYEVPFEYHRNSAVYFADSTQSMHYNLQYTPLYLDFGVSEPHRTHAEDLYELLLGYNGNMWIDTNPTGSHGYSVFNEADVCDWLSQFELIDNPHNINVNLDERSRAYWLEIHNQHIEDEFIKVKAKYEYIDFFQANYHSIYIEEYSNSDSLILHILEDEYLNNDIFGIDFIIASDQLINLGFSGSLLDDYSVDVNVNYFFNTGENLFCNTEYSIDTNNIIWIEDSYYSLLDNAPCLESNYSIYENIVMFVSFLFSEIEINDINGDEIWNIIDVVLVLNFIFGENNLTVNQIINADLNQDGIINILDIVQMVNLILEL